MICTRQSSIASKVSDADSQSSRTNASESDAATLSGVSGHFLTKELAKWRQSRRRSWTPKNAWETWELRVAVYYDRPFGAFFNFLYDVLQFSSGRDKLCAFIQGYAEFASEALSKPDSERHWMYRGIEDSLSNGRKIFRLFKEFREVYKVRRGMNRLLEGISECGAFSIPAICGGLDVLGHCSSFWYYLFDNTLLLTGDRNDGLVISALGGVKSIKRKKNLASISRLAFAMTANLLLLRKATETCSEVRSGEFQGLDDPRLFHSLELLGMSASFCILRSKLGYARLSHTISGLLAMLAAVCGIWSNWRKVCRKKCGTKNFVTSMEKRGRGNCGRRCKAPCPKKEKSVGVPSTGHE